MLFPYNGEEVIQENVPSDAKSIVVWGLACCPAGDTLVFLLLLGVGDTRLPGFPKEEEEPFPFCL